MSVVVEVEQLILPLHNDSERIFEESDNDQESADGRKVRLNGLAEAVEGVFNLAGVRTNLVEDVAIRLLGARRAAVCGRAAEAISRGAALHCTR